MGIEAISSRIMEIQTTIASMSQRTAPVAASASVSTAASSTSTASSFDTVLAQAQSLTSGTSTVTASSASRSTLNADGIPTDLAAYGNGKIPHDALASIGTTGHRLWAPASESFEKLLAAAKADGVDIGITDSYRTYESQVDLAERKGLYSQGGLAATPGTSDHGWGLSLDLKLDGPALAWMRANGAEHGFVEDVPREPWHWTFQGET
ncbi:M15 family metallopeptidase [Sanguibacter antarcticus]|uniref:D-alanyl-D-alanine carboxypeptidase-like protein n=1 Tax=Sanguibacter antarcticus TaxID=372484 RepID=A0A2A9E8G9_9MICO|nr:M15 family metallopeptidase [Sanguibacter antarcticus]PFG34529.1 D-alanyl-D-alanine carboxypeptidase-like protein [Sanguibacter antarcticus]